MFRVMAAGPRACSTDDVIEPEQQQKFHSFTLVLPPPPPYPPVRFRVTRRTAALNVDNDVRRSHARSQVDTLGSPLNQVGAGASSAHFRMPRGKKGGSQVDASASRTLPSQEDHVIGALETSRTCYASALASVR